MQHYSGKGVPYKSPLATLKIENEFEPVHPDTTRFSGTFVINCQQTALSHLQLTMGARVTNPPLISSGPDN